MILYGKFFRGLRIRAPTDLGRSDALGHSRLVVAGVAHSSIFCSPHWYSIGRFAGDQEILGTTCSNRLGQCVDGLASSGGGALCLSLLSKSGPLGILGLLYTPTAMIIAQTLLIAPIIAALSRTILKTLYEEYRDQFASFRLSQFQTVNTLLWEARFMLLTALLAGFGRAIAEVGAVMIVGGNISHYTRVMTTSIALETSKETCLLLWRLA